METFVMQLNLKVIVFTNEVLEGKKGDPLPTFQNLFYLDNKFDFKILAASHNISLCFSLD